MFFNHRFIALALAGLTVMAGVNPPSSLAAQSSKQPPIAVAVDKQLQAAIAKYDIIGLSATVIKDNKIVWQSGYGLANRQTGRPVTSDTIFRVASLSKMVTATALMQLYEQGKFALDDDISTYLGYPVRNPRFPDNKITFRQLLTHTSGIVDSGAYDEIVGNNSNLLHEISLKDLLTPGGRYYRSSSFADYAPGLGFCYSNLGTGIVGSLVEKIAGMPFDKYCSTYIFKPLKMDASFEPADIKNWQNIAVLYRGHSPTKDDFRGVKPEKLPAPAALEGALGYSPAGGLRSSTADFAKFIQAHINGGTYNKARILKKDTADLMHSMQWFGNGMDGFYKQKGLNFHITDDLIKGRRLIGHSGEAYGLSSDAYFDPDSKFGIVFMMNGASYTDAAPFYSVENTIAKTLFDTFAPPETTKPRQLKAKANKSEITVNDRKIILPVPAAVAKEGKTKVLFLPAISAADALKTSIKQNGNHLSFTSGQNTVEITASQQLARINGKPQSLPIAPYMHSGHLMVPVKELADALAVTINLKI